MMRARKAFIFTADAIFAFYLITVMLSVLLLLSYTPRAYVEQSQSIAKDVLLVMGNIDIKDMGEGQQRMYYPYSNHLIYLKNNSPSAWSMFQRTAEHNASVISLYPNSSAVWWSTGRGLGTGSGDALVNSSPVVYNGKIIVNSRNGTYMLDENRGTLIWHLEIPAFSSPAVSNGKIFISSLNHIVYAIDEAGNRVWNHTANGAFLSSPVIHNGRVFVGSMDKWLYSFDEASGNVSFFVASGNITSSPTVYDGKVFILSNDGALYALDENLIYNVLWMYNTSSPSLLFVDPSPAAADGVVYFSNGLVFYALNATTGVQRWNVTFNGVFTSSPVIDAGNIYVGYWNGLTKINATDGSHQNITLSSKVYGSPIISKDPFNSSKDAVILTTADGTVWAFYKENLSLIWSYRLSNSTYASPILVNGRIYIPTIDGNLYSIGNCSLWDENLPVTDSITAFWFIGKRDCARTLAKEFLESAVPSGYGYELVLRVRDVNGTDCNGKSSALGDSIYTNDCNQTRYQRILIQDSKYISGVVQKGSTVYYATNPVQMELRIWN